jgi:hypothetical protein
MMLPRLSRMFAMTCAFAASAVGEDGVGEAELLERTRVPAEEGRVELLQVAGEGHPRLLRELHDGLGPDFLPEPYGRGVLALGEGTARGDDVLVDVVEGLDAPFPEDPGGAPDHDLAGVHGCVIDEGAGEITGLEGGRVDEGHEGRAGGAAALRDTVEHGIVEIAAAHPREDGAGLVVDHHQGALEVFRRGEGLVGMGGLLEGGLLRLVLLHRLLLEVGVLLDLGELLLESAFGEFLEASVDRGMDREAAFRNGLVAEQVDHLLTHLFINEGGFPGDVRLRGDLDLRLAEAVAGVLVDVALRRHPGDDMVAPLLRDFGEASRRTVVGVRNRRGEGRGLDHGEMLGFLAEVALGGRGDAVVAAAEINAVDVELEDALLAVEALLDALGEEDLGEFPAQGAVLQLEGLAGELLRDGRGPLVDPLRAEAVVERPDDPDVIDPVVLVEAAVLGREEGVDEVGRDVVERDGAAVLHEDASEFPTVPVENPARHLDFLEGGEVEGLGEVVAGLQVKEGTCHADGGGDEEKDEEKDKALRPEDEAAAPFRPLLVAIAQGRQIDHGAL